MGVTTMKIISNTSITSTIGVTLMSELTFEPSFRFANAMNSVSCGCFPLPPLREEEQAPVETGALPATQSAACLSAVFDL
jgi:hypothetical protein